MSIEVRAVAQLAAINLCRAYAALPPNQAFQPTSLPPGLRPYGKAAAELGCWAAWKGRLQTSRDILVHMRRIAVVVVGILCTTACAVRSNSGLTPRTNPLLGTWTYQVPGTDCTETYTFMPDGTRNFTSNEERGKSTYRLWAELTHEGSFIVNDTIAETNGGKDCSGGQGAPVGDRVMLFLHFNQSGDQMRMCRNEGEQSCFGPFVRSPE